jgi:hypothetical protein
MFAGHEPGVVTLDAEDQKKKEECLVLETFIIADICQHQSDACKVAA